MMKSRFVTFKQARQEKHMLFSCVQWIYIVAVISWALNAAISGVLFTGLLAYPFWIYDCADIELDK